MAKVQVLRTSILSRAACNYRVVGSTFYGDAFEMQLYLRADGRLVNSLAIF